MRNAIKHPIDEAPFLNIKDPIAAYVLGLLWTDGYLSKRRKSIILEMVSEDIEALKPFIFSFGCWCEHTRLRSGKTRRVTSLSVTNHRLYDFLVENDFVAKSLNSPDKILSRIPDHLKPLFWRGFLDGDGCIYVKDRVVQVSFSGPFDQRWDSMEKLFSKLGIAFILKRVITKTGRHSLVRVSGKKECKNLLAYIYQGYKSSKIGLERKAKKALEALSLESALVLRKDNKTGFRGVRRLIKKDGTLKYQVTIRYHQNGIKKVMIKSFDNLECAAQYYDEIAYKVHGERAVLNRPVEKRYDSD